MTKKIDALLLSAGKSSRMGFTKALVDWHNQKLIQFQVETLLGSGCNNIFIVLGHEKEKIIPYIQKENTKIIYNENYKKGKSSSIIKGINNINKNTNNLLIIGVDQPRPIKFLKKLLHFHWNVGCSRLCSRICAGVLLYITVNYIQLIVTQIFFI